MVKLVYPCFIKRIKCAHSFESNFWRCKYRYDECVQLPLLQPESCSWHIVPASSSSLKVVGCIVSYHLIFLSFLWLEEKVISSSNNGKINYFLISVAKIMSWLSNGYHPFWCRFLESLMNPDVEYTLAITAFWAIETVYQESFAHCLEDGSKTPEELKETCQRWGNEGFGQYCSSLQNITNRRLEKASDDMFSKAEVILIRVLEHEVEFWNMSRGTI